MKHLSGRLLATLSLLAGTPAFASYVSTVDINRFMDVPSETVLVTHNLPDLPYISGVVEIFMHDDADSASESALINLNIFNPVNASTNYSFDLGVLGIFAVNKVGTYAYSVTRMSGDFWLDKSVLTLETAGSTDRVGGATAVPEPGTLMLLAIGLLGIVGIRRLRPAA